MDTTSSADLELESLPILDTAMRRFSLSERRPMKRFVVFSQADKYLIAHHSYRSLRRAERKARSLRKWAVTVGTVVIDQRDYANEIYSEDVMRLKDFKEFMDMI